MTRVAQACDFQGQTVRNVMQARRKAMQNPLMATG
jgi:hypothetical protein